MSTKLATLGAGGTVSVSQLPPTAYVEMATPVGTSSATLEDVTGVSTTITIADALNIAVMCSFQISTRSGGAPSTIAVAVNIDGTDHDELSRFLSGTSDTGIGAIVHRTDTPLAAGTYTVTLRFRRVSGAAVPGIDRADMLIMSMG